MDDAKIINRALARIGSLPIQSVAAPGAPGPGVVDTYYAIREDILSKYPWHFTKRFAALDRLADKPNGWRWAFLLPPSRLALPRGYWESSDISGRPVMRFQIAGGQVYADSEQLYAEFQVIPPPAEWPGYFRELMTLCCSAEYALQIREDPNLRQALRRDAYGPPDMQGEGGQFKVAADLDAQAAPSQQPAGGANPLTDTRSGYDPDDARCGW